MNLIADQINNIIAKLKDDHNVFAGNIELEQDVKKYPFGSASWLRFNVISDSLGRSLKSEKRPGSCGSYDLSFRAFAVAEFSCKESESKDFSTPLFASLAGTPCVSVTDVGVDAEKIYKNLIETDLSINLNIVIVYFTVNFSVTGSELSANCNC